MGSTDDAIARLQADVRHFRARAEMFESTVKRLGSVAVDPADLAVYNSANAAEAIKARDEDIARLHVLLAGERAAAAANTPLALEAELARLRGVLAVRDAVIVSNEEKFRRLHGEVERLIGRIKALEELWNNERERLRSLLGALLIRVEPENRGAVVADCVRFGLVRVRESGKE